TFSVRLPLALPTVQHVPNRVATRDGAISADVLNGRRILVVDDQQDTLEFFAVLLERAGAIPVLATSAPEALARLDKAAPALVIADIGMADADGYDLLRMIRQRDNDVPVIAVTAFAREEDRRRALDEGFREHVAKPIEPEQLISVIASVLKERIHRLT